MRFAALALIACLAGCSLTAAGSGSECHNDSQCGDDVCARSGECLARSSIHEVSVRWTVNGVTADAASCSTRVNSLSNLYIQFDGVDAGDTLRFAPVPCRQGSFFVDKLPKRYLQVELGFEGGAGDVLTIEGTTSQLQFDLFQ